MKTTRYYAGRVLGFLSWPLAFVIIGGSERARVLVRCGREVLVVRDLLAPTKWSLPGGGLHRGEPAATAVLRELQEETELRLTVSQLTLLAVEPCQSRLIRFQCHYFLATLAKPILPQVHWEHIDAQWISMSELNNGNASADVVAALRLVRA